MLDWTILLIVAGSVTAMAAGAQHLVDRYSKRYGLYARAISMGTAGQDRIVSALKGLEGTISSLVGEDAPPPDASAIEALEAFKAIPNKIDSLVEVLKKQGELAASFLSPQPENGGGLPAAVTGSIGGATKATNALMRQASAAVGHDMLGPYGGLLERFAPETYAFLAENPEMILTVLNMAPVQKLIQRFSSMVGQEATVSSSFKPGL